MRGDVSQVGGVPAFSGTETTVFRLEEKSEKGFDGGLRTR